MLRKQWRFNKHVSRFNQISAHSLYKSTFETSAKEERGNCCVNFKKNSTLIISATWEWQQQQTWACIQHVVHAHTKNRKPKTKSWHSWTTVIFIKVLKVFYIKRLSFQQYSRHNLMIIIILLFARVRLLVLWYVMVIFMKAFWELFLPRWEIVVTFHISHMYYFS